MVCGLDHSGSQPFNYYLTGFYISGDFILGGNMVDKDSKKGHNTLLCIQ